MSRNNHYATGNLLEYLNHQKCYKLIGIDLSRQNNTNIPHDKLISEENWKKMMKQQSFYH